METATRPARFLDVHPEIRITLDPDGSVSWDGGERDEVRGYLRRRRDALAFRLQVAQEMLDAIEAGRGHRIP